MGVRVESWSSRKEVGTIPLSRLRQGYGGQAENGWVDVVADGVTPTTGVDYTFRFVFDYRHGVYSVAISYGDVMKPLVVLSSTSLPAGTAIFPLAERKSSISTVRLDGDGDLTSIFGEYDKSDGLRVIIR